MFHLSHVILSLWPQVSHLGSSLMPKSPCDSVLRTRPCHSVTCVFVSSGKSPWMRAWEQRCGALVAKVATDPCPCLHLGSGLAIPLAVWWTLANVTVAGHRKLVPLHPLGMVLSGKKCWKPQLIPFSYAFHTWLQMFLPLRGGVIFPPLNVGWVLICLMDGGSRGELHGPELLPSFKLCQLSCG